MFVEIGGRQQGLLPLKNFADPPEPGTMLDVMVSRFNAADGLYELVLPGATVDVGDWSEVAEGMVVEARVTGHNKGGLECEVNRLRGFIPASQVSMYRVEDLAQFVDQKFACVITEANPDKRNLVLSRRAMLEREKAEAKEKLMAELEVGQIARGHGAQPAKLRRVRRSGRRRRIDPHQPTELGSDQARQRGAGSSGSR